MTPAEIIYHRRVRLLALGEELGNVAMACRQMGISRTRYYEWRNIVADYGLEALCQRSGGPEAMSEPDDAQRAVVDRYVSAFERADVAGLTQLLAADVVLEMPPMLNWYIGPARYAGFIARVFATRGTDWRMVPVAANGQAAVAAYVRAHTGGYELHTLQVFTVERTAISRTTAFQNSAVFELFGLPPRSAEPAPR